ncbi:extensin-like domain-containing protein [Terrihabitans sp. B22-R8]|uniref:extensin-like domain-containing protein n=1 Tax=Terrihabitans sp. B22-R8 TaxID=3425128 RepID=UPI00403C6630
MSSTEGQAAPAPVPRPSRFARLLPRVLLGLCAIALATFVAVERYAPLDPSAQPHLFTGLQLALMRAMPERCPAALARAEGISFTPAPRPMENGCGYPDGVRLRSTRVDYGGPVLLACPAAIALVMWERQVVQPQARRIFGKPVARVQTFGTYSCRNIYGRQNARRSQHARANAIDIAGFTLAGGEAISVRRDWTESEKKSEFLRAVRQGACGPFGTVLSPDYNAAHADHFHLDMANWRVCR